METLIVKQNGNESVKANLLFSIKMNNYSTIHKNYESYNEAKSKIERSKKIFKHSKFEIIVTEN
tara:strand:+ start:175 stop:366 length:192 start_codon:yes stop_codon:yes gene_type:complete